MIFRIAVASCLTLITGALCAEELTLEKIHSDAGLAGPRLRSPQFSPDSKLVTYLQSRPDQANRYDLWAYDLATQKHARLVNSDDLHQGDEVLSDEEKARRERMRLNASGIVSYQWSEDGTALLFPLAGDLYYYDLSKKAAKQLTKTEAFELDAKFSPDGKKVSFIRDQNIFVLDLDTEQETALTTDGKGSIKNGMAEFVAQEEMAQFTGYWWSPDSKQIAFVQYDDSQVEEVQRNEIYADRIDIIKQRYPYTGATNVSLKLKVISLENNVTLQIPTGPETDFYLPRVDWTHAENLLTYQWQSRNQQALELREVRTQTAEVRVINRDVSPTWINLHKDLLFLKKNKGFIWSSESSGFKHLYHVNTPKNTHLYHADKTEKTALTQGEWQVHRLVSVDEENGWVYFTGWVETPTERHLYRVNLDGSTASSPQKISQRPGWHSITFSEDGRYYFDSYSNFKQPTQVSLHKADGTHSTFLLENKVDQEHLLYPYLDQLITPTYGTLAADDGTPLHYRLFKPTTPAPEGGFPVIVYLYGGPHGGQQVRNAWSSRNLWTHYMVNRGYVFFTLDNRGSPNRGKAFEDVIYRELATNELRDQVIGANWLKKQPWVDPKRIGIHGHSYGGYMTLMAMFRASDTYACGVSGAPVTDFRLYDTHYTERYLSTPQDNTDGYEASSVFPYSKDLKGKLLIYHGMADDNVLFKNTTKLVSQLQEQGKLFEFMAYPGAKHSISGTKPQLHLSRTITDFFDRAIGKK